MRVFAYGSNMCLGWLRSRTPSAQFISAAKLDGHVLRFHKRSKDGSGKADAFRTGNPVDVVWGVVFEVADSEEGDLDSAEGLGSGYSKRTVEVIAQDGQPLAATMYFADADAIDNELRPYSWYMRFVVEGAQQHGLPADYVARLSAEETWEDPKKTRDSEKREIRC